MKRIKIIMTASILAMSCFAKAETYSDGAGVLGISVSSLSFMAPTMLSYFLTEGSKDILEAAQEDAVKFVATNGKIEKSGELLQAIKNVDSKFQRICNDPSSFNNPKSADQLVEACSAQGLDREVMLSNLIVSSLQLEKRKLNQF